MKSFLVSLFLCTVLLGYAEAGRDFKWECKGKPVKHMDEVYDYREQCEKEGVKDTFCKTMCAAKKIGYLDALGNHNKTMVYQTLEQRFSEPDATEGKKIWDKCEMAFGPKVHRMAGATDLADEPPHCANRYAEHWTCYWVATMKHCESESDDEIIGIKGVNSKTAMPSGVTM